MVVCVCAGGLGTSHRCIGFEAGLVVVSAGAGVVGTSQRCRFGCACRCASVCVCVRVGCCGAKFITSFDVLISRAHTRALPGERAQRSANSLEPSGNL